MEQLIIANNLYPSDKILKLRETLIKSEKDIDLNYPVKDKEEHFQLGKAYKMHTEFHKDDPKIFTEVYKTGHEWLNIIRQYSQDDADLILYTLKNTFPCQYDIYPHPYTSIDVDWRRKDINPKQNAEFMLDRFYTDMYNLVLSCNIFYQHDRKYYREDARKHPEQMLLILNKYKTSPGALQGSW